MCSSDLVKNSVNLFQKKNWVGSFAVPWAVINDTALLATLPDRDFVCGFSEAVKVSLLKDRQLFEMLCDNADAIRQRDMSVASPIIQRSAVHHLQHITRGGDPFELRPQFVGPAPGPGLLPGEGGRGVRRARRVVGK